MCAKANQPYLYQAIEQAWQQGHPWSCYDYTQHSHGRTVHRRVQVYRPSQALQSHWSGLASLIVVERSGTRAQQPFCERQYYISSLITCAHGFAQLVQGHWGIENRLHWIKDVSLGEDDAPYLDKRAAANWSIVRTFFITLARRLGFHSIASAKRQLANQFEQVFLSLQ
uniref:ISAs1 family transposase n=1 Tax=Gloeocapsa sp. PCC 7428 TaxID=1173026 RepID=UPI00068860B3|nr:ISAs1 family transposase [Gloeocapsa sp. PCC 7428]